MPVSMICPLKKKTENYKHHKSTSPCVLLSLCSCGKIILLVKQQLPHQQMVCYDELGYEDEYYFSRFFKVNAGVSPQLYRDTVGYAEALA